MNGHFVKKTWNDTRQFNKKQFKNFLYPSYETIVKLKDACISPLESISVTERGAKVELQALLDHTTERIFLTLDQKVINSLKGKTLTLNFKAGMDGSSSQRVFHQTSKKNVTEKK